MKDYKNWHVLKIEIENKKNEKFFNNREIWWCSIGENIGHEEDGKNNLYERPVLIFRKFNKNIFIGIPLTTKYKENDFQYSFKTNNIESSAILSQTRLLSSKRLIRKISKISIYDFNNIKKAFINLI